MNIKTFVISRFASWIAGGEPFEAMKGLAQSVNDGDLSGAEKRDLVLDAFSSFGYALAGWLANLLLELAVAWLKAKAGEDG